MLLCVCLLNNAHFQTTLLHTLQENFVEPKLSIAFQASFSNSIHMHAFQMYVSLQVVKNSRYAAGKKASTSRMELLLRCE